MKNLLHCGLITLSISDNISLDTNWHDIDERLIKGEILLSLDFVELEEMNKHN